MIKFPKDNKVKPTGPSEVHQPVVGEADPATPISGRWPIVRPDGRDARGRRPQGEPPQRPHAQRPPGAADRGQHREFGWIMPIVVDEEGMVLAGHGRLRRPRCLIWPRCRPSQVKHLTPERKRAFMLADNRLAELAGWDEELLTIELKELSDLAIDFEFEVTGFDTVDLDRLEAPKSAKTSEAGGGAGAGARPPGRQRPRRPVEARPAPSVVRQRPGGGLLPEAAGRPAGADGVHRPAVQRRDRRPRLWPGLGAPS